MLHRSLIQGRKMADVWEGRWVGGQKITQGEVWGLMTNDDPCQQRVGVVSESLTVEIVSASTASDLRMLKNESLGGQFRYIYNLYDYIHS